jgi:ABC-type transport system involved in cytochrome bd biosynthesis fused ATPase/permease subunit
MRAVQSGRVFRKCLFDGCEKAFATEEAIVDVAGRLAEGRTTPLITRRQNVELRCERIPRVDRGQIVESALPVRPAQV